MKSALEAREASPDETNLACGELISDLGPARAAAG